MKEIKLIRIYLLLVLFVSFGAVAFATTTLDFVWINIWSINQKFSEVTFQANWNDFMWSIFWLNAKNLISETNHTWEIITISGGTVSKRCGMQVRWIYYNSQRWNRLWPMDQDTLKYFRDSAGVGGGYSGLNLSWWLYTSCSGDEYSIYGQLTYHVEWDTEDSHIVAWVKYNRDNNTISGALARSLQRFDNKYPIWYIYDDHWGGIWFIWSFTGWWEWNPIAHSNIIAKLNQWSWINNLFWYGGSNNSEINGWWISIRTTAWNAINTLMNAWIQWTIWLSFSVNTVEKNTILWNFDRKTLIFNALNVNFSKLINVVKKNAESLCKGKYENENQPTYSTNKNLFCIEFPATETQNNIVINNADREDLKNKTIIVKNWDVRIAWWMWVSEWPVNIFIDRWNLLLANNTDDAVGFDKNGYATTTNDVTKWINLKWNFIVNGLVMWANKTTRAKESFGHKLFVNWKFASLNTPNYPSLNRTDQVSTLFGTSVNNNWIWLGNVFKRECDPISWSWSDNGRTACNNSTDRNALLPLIIIDGNYISPLLQQ